MSGESCRGALWLSSATKFSALEASVHASSSSREVMTRLATNADGLTSSHAFVNYTEFHPVHSARLF